MKCPKCNYLGFETGDRCKNCGYDFSLLAVSPSASVSQTPEVPTRVMQTAQRRSVSASRARRDLPLLTLAADEHGDEPLLTLPRAPRPPLAVRRTPERLRTTPHAVREQEAAPVLTFEDESGAPVQLPPASPPRVSPIDADRTAVQPSPLGARLRAVAIDLLMLSGIDLAVIYFTLRLAGLPMRDWTTLPPAPLLAFLLLVKLSYFSAFTAAGGQTIGKMAMCIQVVSADDRPIDAALALRRTLAGLASIVLLGAGFLPALFGSERRAFHDRVARTRVVVLPSVAAVRSK